MPLDTAKATVILRDLTATFDKSVRAANPFYPSVCNVIPSDGLDEKYGWIGDMPGMREWLGDRLFHELRAANYVVTNKHFESSLRIKKTDIADDRMGMYPPLLETLAAEASYHPDELWFNALANGEATACFDDQFFFDTDHAWGDSGSQSNDLTYNAADHTAVTAAEFKAAFHAAREAMLNYVNDQGKLFHRPTVNGMGDLMLLVPTELELAAKEAITAILTTNGGSNVVLEVPKIVVSAHLSSAVKFYLFHLGQPLKPFVFQAREPLSRQMKGLEDLETKDVKFMTEARYNVGYLAWWNAVLTTFN
jgi:phage major head subunit gpT-like protein